VKIHEYQAKDILRRYGIPVQPGIVATTPDEAEAAAGLAASADVDLGLDDDGHAELAGGGFGFVRGGGDDAGLHGDAVPAEDVLRLVLVDFHL